MPSEPSLALRDTYSRTLLRRVEQQWPHLAELTARAKETGPYGRRALRQLARNVLRGKMRFSGGDALLLVKWADGA